MKINGQQELQDALDAFEKEAQKQNNDDPIANMFGGDSDLANSCKKGICKSRFLRTLPDDVRKEFEMMDEEEFFKRAIDEFQSNLQKEHPDGKLTEEEVRQLDNLIKLSTNLSQKQKELKKAKTKKVLKFVGIGVAVGAIVAAIIVALTKK